MEAMAITPLYAALLHYPVTDRRGDAVTTSVTTLDIHDIARAARTYGLHKYFVVTPTEPHHWLVRRIISHWQGGWGVEYNPTRGEALGAIEVVSDLGCVTQAICDAHGVAPVYVATSARRYPNRVGFAELHRRLHEAGQPPHCLLFGTGYGLHPEVIIEADLVLEPIDAGTDYNHLSVRSAASIIFDRLLAPDR